MPRRRPAQDGSGSSRRIQAGPREHAKIAVCSSSFHTLDHVLIENILCDHPTHADCGSDDVVDEALLRRRGLYGPDRGLADGSNLELRAVKPREARRSQPGFPVCGILTEFRAAVTDVVSSPQESCDTALNRMAHVVDVELVAIGPTVQASDSPRVIVDEAALQSGSRSWLGQQAKSLLDGEKAAGGPNQPCPVHIFRRAPGRAGGQNGKR